MTKVTIAKGSPMIIKGNNYKFIQEVMNNLRITKIRVIKDSILINPRYELGS